MRKKLETCPFCEASFELVNGKFPQHLDVFRRGACGSVGKTLAETKTEARDPKYYLSTSEGKWRVIHQGVPICPDTDEEGARSAARFAGCDISHGRIWNGDEKRWTSKF